MTLDDEQFKDLPLDTFEPTDCSPEALDPDFLGMLINAPKKVGLQKDPEAPTEQLFTIIPVCGYYMLDAAILPPVNNVARAMQLVATNVKTQKEYLGHVAEPYVEVPSAEAQTAAPRDREFEGLRIGGYFNVNLAECVRLPQGSGVYEVFVAFGDKNSDSCIRSNVITIEIVEQ